ncbi:MAG: DNA-directed RNA polymerase subunit beta', partial [Chloroflexi bacterium]|nr:DNA-directed RNA polymerase subunit beta' [Chloroflexota bacterium]
VIAAGYKVLTEDELAGTLDKMKDLGFKYATKSGITIAMSDVNVPGDKVLLMKEAEAKAAVVEKQFARGIITEDERYNGVVEIWMETTDQITEAIAKGLDKSGSIYMMATSGAKGNISQIRQMAGMRGLMTDPSGRIIDFPIKSSLREGLTALEYFISTHGARKGLADTALRTSGSGYLTRRLIDVTQDLVVYEEDCGTMDGVWMIDAKEEGVMPPLTDRITGRVSAVDIVNPKTEKVIVKRNEEISEKKAEQVVKAGITNIYARSPLACKSRRGICRKCYGRDIGKGKTVEFHTAIGIIAAQSIGEPGTQLTLRTFHTGGVVGLDITTGLPRVEELFEARIPKAQAIITEIDGVAEIIEDEEGSRHIAVTAYDQYEDEYEIPKGFKTLVKDGQQVDIGMLLAQPPVSKGKE